ncbi:cob(I)yrinic acid a,c-diamide adenosyltransferase|uniref:Corrinoid adenosyltransferase n=2 Tax=Dendrosporobacter quercicolus TaxID=146817 RepID=A0A1G9NGR9_9FIRM|nr:cob(I)yrinic acid a,c-diamide adenosyltransferase [Dendrosporobacter quercicolus DSM 1736]SDL85584.1 cob(I)alamin adenosyltransferase [Dendrosporobacter quercicolus]
MMIYTRGGDQGQTSLLDGTRVPKHSARVDSYGTIDELNSTLGFAKNFVEDAQIREQLHIIQRELFAVAAELADPSGREFSSKLTGEHITRFESWIDVYVARLNPAAKFIVPGSSKASGALHMARTVCRRAERLIIALAEQEPVNPLLLKYVNRLSDVLYTLARTVEEEQELMTEYSTKPLQ